MAYKKSRGKDKQGESSSLLRKNLPPTFKTPRDAGLQLSQLERNLFTDMEERESGNYIISGISKRVSQLDFTAFTFAVGQILFNQSFLHGNEDINSGTERKEAVGTLVRAAKQISGKEELSIKEAKKIALQSGIEAYYSGTIEVTLKELCLKGYGADTTENRKKMDTLIDTIHSTPVTIMYPISGRKFIEEETYLCLKKRKATGEDGSITYNLELNPIFGSRIKDSFGELPQDVILQLDSACRKKKQRKQPAHYLLLRWLCLQDKRTPHTLTIDTLLYELRMEDYFREHPALAERQLLAVCEAMKDIGILSSFQATYSTSGKRQRLAKITFNLNPAYLREPKGEEPSQKTGSSKDGKA